MTDSNTQRSNKSPQPRITHKQLVMDLYKVLDAAMSARVGATSEDEEGVSTLTFEGGFPGYAARLLPRYGGWTMHPLWLAPRPDSWNRMSIAGPLVGRNAGRRYRDELLQLLTGTGDQLGKLHTTVLVQIIYRARAHGLLNRSEVLFDHAIRDAVNDLAEAERTWRADSPDVFADNHKLSLLRVRLYWLTLWRRHDKRRRAWARQKTPTRARADNFSALVKPPELRMAWNILDGSGVFETDRDCYNALGLWYAWTLWLCGATWKDLKAIRQTNPRRVRSEKDRQRNTRRFLCWTEIARKKMYRADWDDTEDP